MRQMRTICLFIQRAVRKHRQQKRQRDRGGCAGTQECAQLMHMLYALAKVRISWIEATGREAEGTRVERSSTVQRGVMTLWYISNRQIRVFLSRGAINKAANAAV